MQVVDFVLPPKCVGCGKVGKAFCAECRAVLPRLKEVRVCGKCARPCPSCTSPHKLCPHCTQHPLALEKISAAVFFQGNVPQLIHQFKYYRLFGLATVMAEVMQEENQLTAVSGELLLPIPLHPQREQERGYNQSALLARELAIQTNLPYQPHALQRIRHTPPQAQLPAAARRTNVQDAFTANSRLVSSKRVILVDDVCTTGSTLSAAAEALYQAGATAVSAYCFARAV
jgi:ComF family protein